jgi:hypothetical protein
LSPAFEEVGACACADIEQVKIDNTRATLQNDFMTSSKGFSIQDT